LEEPAHQDLSIGLEQDDVCIVRQAGTRIEAFVKTAIGEEPGDAVALQSPSAPIMQFTRLTPGTACVTSPRKFVTAVLPVDGLYSVTILAGTPVMVMVAAAFPQLLLGWSYPA
jgi:hypothetical protein